ncbi:MAG TPA: hypothetical protein VK652_11680 [Steroidobacteraceae bacterium]|nr:hypothetical protein [Steroidobacteraceae bacterium]
MSREVPTTRYFAVGYFTAEQLEEKHRAMLARAAQNAAVTEIRSAVEVVSVTVFDVDIGTETVEMAITKVSMVVQDTRLQAAGVSFAVERFDSSQFPGTLTPQDAFTQYLASAEGIASFGTATAVQLFAIDVDAVQDLAKS